MPVKSASGGPFFDSNHTRLNYWKMKDADVAMSQNWEKCLESGNKNAIPAGGLAPIPWRG
jgi:hypothetical protein